MAIAAKMRLPPRVDGTMLLPDTLVTPPEDADIECDGHIVSTPGGGAFADDCSSVGSVEVRLPGGHGRSAATARVMTPRLTTGELVGGGGGSGSPRLSVASSPSWCDRRPLHTPQSGRRLSPRGPRNNGNSNVLRRSSAPAFGPEAAEKVLAGFGAEGQPITKGDVSLCVRLRPGLLGEDCVHTEGTNTVRWRGPGNHETDAVYRCDHSFGPDTTQEQVYDKAVTPICEAVIKGYNGAVIAYGQTGSGKTHTMIGTGGNKGVAARAVSAIFEALAKRPCWSVEASVLEIYNERVRDLLAPGPSVTHVDIHEVPCREGLVFRCPEATTWKAETPDEALAALTEGMRRRETARTDMNHNSSRSHLIFTINTTQIDKEVGATLRGRLHLVDLAGSERLKRSMSSERVGNMPRQNSRPSSSNGGGNRTPRDQRREAGEINKSLSQLALVIQRLTSHANSALQYVPYRDSMLTRLLAESFGGNSKTCLIITCSTLSRDRDETRCSLEFGKRAKLVKNRAEINLEVDHEPTPVMQALVAKELTDMQREREDMLREREMLINDRTAMQEKLARVETSLREAVDDVMGQQERRVAEVRQLEEDKRVLQQRLVEAANTAAQVQEEFSAEVNRLHGNQLSLREQLQSSSSELAQLREATTASAAHAEVERRRLAAELEDHARQATELRADLARMKQELVAGEAAREATAAKFAAEKAVLAKQLDDALRNASSGHMARVVSAEGGAKIAAAEAVEADPGILARQAQQAETLRRNAQVAEEDRLRLEELQAQRLAALDDEVAGLRQKWGAAASSSGSLAAVAEAPGLEAEGSLREEATSTGRGSGSSSGVGHASAGTIGPTVSVTAVAVPASPMPELRRHGSYPSSAPTSLCASGCARPVSTALAATQHIAGDRPCVGGQRGVDQSDATATTVRKAELRKCSPSSVEEFATLAPQGLDDPLAPTSPPMPRWGGSPGAGPDTPCCEGDSSFSLGKSLVTTRRMTWDHMGQLKSPTATA